MGWTYEEIDNIIANAILVKAYKDLLFQHYKLKPIDGYKIWIKEQDSYKIDEQDEYVLDENNEKILIEHCYTYGEIVLPPSYDIESINNDFKCVLSDTK